MFMLSHSANRAFIRFLTYLLINNSLYRIKVSVYIK